MFRNFKVEILRYAQNDKKRRNDKKGCHSECSEESNLGILL